MAKTPKTSVSFSTIQRWGIFFSVIVSIVAVFALVVMVNYLGSHYFVRQNWGRQSDNRLSLRTIALLKSITNDVTVIIYYDRSDNLYENVASMLSEYQLANPRISVQTVDYIFNPVQAQQVKTVYKLGAGLEKNVVIFDCGGRKKIIPETELGDYQIEQTPESKQATFEKHLRAFNGEQRFDSALSSVINSKPRKAYFLEGHGEHELESSENDGYQKFGSLLEGDSIMPAALHLTGTNTIPADCNLLVIAGPRRTIRTNELAEISKYLDQGGRLFVLFNNYGAKLNAGGLEGLLAKWNVRVGFDVVGDPPNALAGSGGLVATNFNPNQPISKSLLGSTLVMALPRSIEPSNDGKQGPESPKVVGIVSTSSSGTINGNPAGNPIILAVAGERETVQGVISDHGSTAFVATGDSLMLQNQIIDAEGYANSDFAQAVVDWLMDQRQLIQGISPRPIQEYKLMMTTRQFHSIAWIFLGMMPGGILAFGGLVWLRRRR